MIIIFLHFVNIDFRISLFHFGNKFFHFNPGMEKPLLSKIHTIIIFKPFSSYNNFDERQSFFLGIIPFSINSLLVKLNGRFMLALFINGIIYQTRTVFICTVLFLSVIKYSSCRVHMLSVNVLTKLIDIFIWING